jgi:hypothetical protein
MKKHKIMLVFIPITNDGKKRKSQTIFVYTTSVNKAKRIVRDDLAKDNFDVPFKTAARVKSLV